MAKQGGGHKLERPTHCCIGALQPVRHAFFFFFEMLAVMEKENTSQFAVSGGVVHRGGPALELPSSERGYKH